jgi:hypothetical protein
MMDDDSPGSNTDADNDPFVSNPTPARPARLSSSVSQRNKFNLTEIDSGICLVTRNSLPMAAIQDAHILQRRTPVNEVRYLSLPCG